MATLVPLEAVDPHLIEQLLDSAFGEERKARTAYRIREGMDWLPQLSFAALDDDEYLVGSIQIWPVGLGQRDGKQVPMLMVGPVAVMPDRQREGFGVALMGASLGALGDGNPLPQVLIGDEDYYGRWGFSPRHTLHWRCPGPYEQDRLLVRSSNVAVLPHEGMLGPWRGETSS